MNWINRLFNKNNKKCDIHSGSFLQDRSLLIKKQEIEDRMFYDNIKAEAMRRINKTEGWLIGSCRLMQIYTIYDVETAKYKNADSLKMCKELVDKFLLNYH